MDRTEIIQRHPESFRHDWHINVEVCERMLLDIKQILDSKGIPFWLMMGTFLGVYRGEKLIPWDGDMDLAVYQEDMERIASCEELFVEKGFEFAPEPDPVLYRDNEHCDLCVFRFEGTKRVTVPHPVYRIDADAFETPNWIEFLGQTWRILSEPEKWLQYIYGPNWKKQPC